MDNTPGATELGFPPSGRNNSQQPGSGAAQTKATARIPTLIPGRAQAQPRISQPRASERPGPHSRPSTGGVSQDAALQAHTGGTRSPAYRTVPPHLTLSKKPRGARGSRQRLSYRLARPAAAEHHQALNFGNPGTHRAGRSPHTQKQHLNLHPLTGQGGVIPTSWMARAAGCNAAASPHPITGRAGRSGDRGLRSLRHTPRVRGCHAASRTGGHARTGPSPAYRVASATELSCGSDLY